MSTVKKIHLEISERKLLLRIVDVLVVLIALFLIGEQFDFSYFQFNITNFYCVIALGLYILFFGSIFEMYNLQASSNQYLIVKNVILTTSFTVFFYLLTPKITPVLPENRIQIIFFYLSILMALLGWRFLYLTFLATDRFVKKVVFVCESSLLTGLIEDLVKVNPHYQVVGFVSSNENHINMSNYYKIPFHTFESFVKENLVSEIVVAFKKEEGITIELYKKILNLLESGVVIREYDSVYESSTYRLPVTYLSKDFYKYFPFSRSNNNKFYIVLSTFFEILFSLIGLGLGCLLLPVLLLLNFIWNRGPLFYTQIRVGKNNKPFKIYKLRSMIVNAEKDGAVFASANDVRITPFGKFLRKSRLDEVPQFINVLKGEMAFIGPRPERPVFVNQIAENLPFYQTRHVIKPGLTGWAQVNHSYTDSVDDALIKLQYDLFYIKHRSIFLDINILIKTIGTILFFKGQ